MTSAQRIGLNDAFAYDAAMQLQWRAFLKKNRREPLQLREVVIGIRERALQFGFAGT